MDWKTKLTSRKFWMAVAGFVSMLLVALGTSEEGIAQVTALIMAEASVVAYIIGEGLVDAASAKEIIDEYEYEVVDPPEMGEEIGTQP